MNAEKYEEKQYWLVILYCPLICLDEVVNFLSRKTVSEINFVNGMFRCYSDQNYVVEFDYLTSI
jgi:ferritin